MIDRRELFRLVVGATAAAVLRIPPTKVKVSAAGGESFGSFGLGTFDSRGWWTTNQVAEFARYQDTFAAGLEKVYRAKLEEE